MSPKFHFTAAVAQGAQHKLCLYKVNYHKLKSNICNHEYCWSEFTCVGM